MLTLLDAVTTLTAEGALQREREEFAKLKEDKKKMTEARQKERVEDLQRKKTEEDEDAVKKVIRSLYYCCH